MNKVTLAILGVVVVVGGIIASGAMFTVHQTTQVLVLQFGNPIKVIKEPGLHFKMPFLQNVEFYDSRVLDLDPPVQEVILADQKRLNVDVYARYKIIDPLEYRKRALTDANFRDVFGRRLNAAVRAEIGQILLGDMLTAKRAESMTKITAAMKASAPEFGVEVVDIRIGRTDLPDETAQSVYNRMRSDRVATRRGFVRLVRSRNCASKPRRVRIEQSFLPRPSGSRKFAVVKVKVSVTECWVKLSARTRNFLIFTGPWKLTARP